MGTAVVNLAEISAQWRVARKLYVVYSALVKAFAIGELCPDLETPINRSDPEMISRIDKWFGVMDQKVEVHQIRQLLQATDLSTEENIRLLLNRQLKSKSKTSAVRDKVDYLLVQYFAHCAPSDSHNRKMSQEEVADVLHPILGEVDVEKAPYQDAIAAVLRELDACHSLADLLNGGVLDRARALKTGAADDFFAPAVLVTFTRFNYLIRLGFFRLMHADLHAIRHSLHELELRGQKLVDCSSAGLSAQETVVSLRQICHEWKKPFRAAYSAGNNFRQLVEIRAAVEHALTQAFDAKSEKSISTQPVAERTVQEAPTSAAKAFAAAASAVVPQVPVVVIPTPELPKATEQKPEAKARRIVIGGAKAAQSLPKDVDSCLEQLAERLLTAKESVSVTHVELGETKLLLASWELAAFIRGGDEVSDTLQRVVAARALLTIWLEHGSANEDLAQAVQSAKAEIALLQSRVEDAKRARNIDAAVNLAASGKRLLAVMEEAKKK